MSQSLNVLSFKMWGSSLKMRGSSLEFRWSRIEDQEARFLFEITLVFWKSNVEQSRSHSDIHTVDQRLWCGVLSLFELSASASFQ